MFILATLLPLRAQFTEYPIPSETDQIAAGSDGAIWFAEFSIGKIARISASGTVTEYPLPNTHSFPMGIIAGPDGALWFIEALGGKIGRITTSGNITEFARQDVKVLASGPDGAVWFIDPDAASISRIDASGSITEYPAGSINLNYVYSMTAGPDGALWFTESLTSKIGRITTSGAVTEFPLSSAKPGAITTGPDGALWFTEVSKVGRITTSGSITEYSVPPINGAIANGPDGALWFTALPQNGHPEIVRMTTAGSVTEIPLPTSAGTDSVGGMTAGPDGALWFIGPDNQIGRYAPGGNLPNISSLSPSNATAGMPTFTLTVNGNNFAPEAVVNWSLSIPTTTFVYRTTLATNYVSPNQVTAIVPASLTAAEGAASIAVSTNAGTSNTLNFPINPGPVIDSLNPLAVAVGAPSFSLTVNGSGFTSGAIVDWNGSPLSTSYASPTQLTAAVPASLIAAPGTAAITVMSSGATSNTAMFTINPPPVITSLNPPSAAAGAPGFTLTVDGAGFDPGTVVYWNGSPLPTSYVGFGQLTALVAGNLITTGGMDAVKVTTDGVTSNTAIFAVTSFAINSLNPASAPAGSPAFALTLSGTGFTPGTTVNWNGSTLATRFLNSTEITASVPASMIASAGTATVTAVSGFGPSAQAKFTVTAPLASPCSNIGGAWSWSESGSYTITISAPVETDTVTNSLTGSGNVLITQTGCSISYSPVGTGLIAAVLTPDQLAALTRTGAVNGNSVSVSGLLALLETVSPAGFAVTSISKNTLTATSGQVTSNKITLNSTGTFSASGIYILNGQSGAFSLTITATSTAALTRISGPVITSVAVANGVTGIGENTWIVIKGQNLVPSTTPAAGVIWSDAPDFAQGHMPTELSGVSLTVNNKPAFIYFYCSAATSAVCTTDQINVLTPLDSTVGPVSIVATNNGASTPAFAATMESLAPSFLQFGTGGYAAATHLDGSLLGPATLYPGASTPAYPGEPIVLYGVGFGLPTTPLVNGSSSQTGSLRSPPVCQMAGTAAPVTFAGLISPGLYQFNLMLPTSAQNGDNSLSCTYQGFSAASSVLISVQQ